MPSVAKAAAGIDWLNVPARTRNSLTNGARPGSERLDNPATRKMPARIGATFCTPPKSEIFAEPRRAISMPVTRNNAAVESPWLNMLRVEPTVEGVVKMKMPRTMKPKCCLLYTSDAADDLTRVDLGGRRIIKKKNKN